MTTFVGINPTLVERIGRVLAAMEAIGHPMKVVQGARTVAQQQALYAQGRTAPGHIVTQCDGVLKKSNHQGGFAVDCAFQGAQPFGEQHPWAVYGVLVQTVGLVWGGGWTKPDRPHAELPT